MFFKKERNTLKMTKANTITKTSTKIKIQSENIQIKAN